MYASSSRRERTKGTWIPVLLLTLFLLLQATPKAQREKAENDNNYQKLLIPLVITLSRCTSSIFVNRKFSVTWTVLQYLVHSPLREQDSVHAILTMASWLILSTFLSINHFNIASIKHSRTNIQEMELRCPGDTEKGGNITSWVGPYPRKIFCWQLKTLGGSQDAMHLHPLPLHSSYSGAWWQQPPLVNDLTVLNKKQILVQKNTSCTGAIFEWSFEG